MTLTRKQERLRMLQVDIPCMFACPAETNVPRYIHAIAEHNYDESHAINQAKNLLPGILGRVCTRPCELACRHGYSGNGEPVSICRLKRAAFDLKTGSGLKQRKQPKSGQNVAVVGAGPSGLAAARDLLLWGHHVTLYEASERLGGMIPLAIPEYRLPRTVIEEDITHILALKPRVALNTVLGKDIGLEALLKEYDAVLLSLGCQRSVRLDIPGEEIDGVRYGLEFLTAVNRGKTVHMGQRVLVVGGGYTAVDCARTLVRLGAEDVTMVFWMTPSDITIDAEEMEHLEMEGIRLQYLTTVVRFYAGQDGKLETVDLVRTKVKNGLVRNIRDSRWKEHFDSAVICIGQGPEKSDLISDPLRRAFNDGRLIVDTKTLQTPIRGLFGSGDYVSGTRSIIDAIADGRKAAMNINAFLTGKRVSGPDVKIFRAATSGRKRTDDFIPRVAEKTTVGKKIGGLRSEVNQGFDAHRAHSESTRCYLCQLHFEIDIDRCIFCMRCIDEAPIDCIKQVKMLGEYEVKNRPYTEADTWNQIGLIYIDNDLCVRCGKCYEVCPTRCISVTEYTLVDPLFGEKM